MQPADAQHLRRPKHDDPERLRMIRECMDMHGKRRGDMPFHSGGNERLYAPAWRPVATMDKN